MKTVVGYKRVVKVYDRELGANIKLYEMVIPGQYSLYPSEEKIWPRRPALCGWEKLVRVVKR